MLIGLIVAAIGLGGVVGVSKFLLPAINSQIATDSYNEGESLKAIQGDGELGKLSIADAWYQKGLVLANGRLYQEAFDAFEKTVQLNPDNYEAWNSRGVALYRLGRSEDALDSFNKAVEIKPDYEDAINNRNLLLRELGR